MALQFQRFEMCEARRIDQLRLENLLMEGINKENNETEI
jgi:hypothetical protein